MDIDGEEIYDIKTGITIKTLEIMTEEEILKLMEGKESE